MTERPAGEAPQQSLWRRQVETIIETQIARSPFLVQSRAVWRQLEHERESWPLLIPLVLIAFALIYRSERKKVFAVQRELDN
jgi:hypothetical protein